MDEFKTKPMLETILETLNALEAKMDARFDALDNRMMTLERRIYKLEGIVADIRSDVSALMLQTHERQG